MELTGTKEIKLRARTLRLAMSLPERLLWQALRKKQTELRFRRQHPAGPFVLDFYCDSAKLCVEVDGSQHDFVAKRDVARDRWLEGQGVRTIRVTAKDVLENLEGVVAYIREQAVPPPSRCA
jgi:very-short-patch-repair endonuclease